MSDQTQHPYKRILLKLSGEALRAPGSKDNISPEIVARIAREIAEAQQQGNLQIAM
jgi:uridylate kinase